MLFLTRLRDDRRSPLNAPSQQDLRGTSVLAGCHLMNQAYYHGKKLKWDPAKMEFTGGTGKAEWLTRDYKNGWKLG